ncbi:CheR family methyltransferase [Profundibacterium mesophilum]|uniref:CheR family methyltransferase n=1 Tax=Profundibacterium mesophilum TaxID=1258573 RepID=UPI0019164DAD|nr:CheR family methyltransferase [Profundibacterium mesophilum]
MENSETLPPEATRDNTPVCAIGASAGGVKALRSLFRQLPDDLGLAYVVIVHLSPEHPSLLAEILSGCTRMPVHQVEDTPELHPDCVYVIPPDKELVIDGNNIHARDFTEARGRRAPVDLFFRSVASARGDGMAIVLSGAGADGSIGVRAIAEAGGVVFAQDPAEAEFGAMPQNAIATGVVNFVASISPLVERMVEVAKSKEAVRSLDADSSANDLRRIVAFLRARTGHDFSSYKRATVMRRVLRRMQVQRITTLAAYGEFVRSAPEEAQELFGDLLISVTQFFRDEAHFDALKDRVIVPLLQDASNRSEDIRIWSVGCATGEEAYSLAITILEETDRLRLNVPFQIFASDLDEGALGTAREGRYPKSIAADVSQQRLSRFFVDEGTHFRIRKEVRDVVLFASHSVLKDPPFMRLDLITCRNLMIYLERMLQSQLLNLMHYALNPNGYLFLGSAETADATSEFFTPLDRDARIYRAKPTGRRNMPALPHVSAEDLSRSRRKQIEARRSRHDVPIALHAEALESAAPPSVLVDESAQILHLSPNAGRYILHSSGTFSGRLTDVVRPELRLDLKIAIDRAAEGLPSLTHPVQVDFTGEARRVAMQISPVPVGDNATRRALVLFLDAGQAQADGPEQEEAFGGDNTEERRLHAELKAAQQALVISRAEHETAIEDLRAANEELQSTNEEYRSTSEELETSKEELQSMNEELQTVNAELKSKLESISTAHSDLQNLTSATEIGTLFLDAKLRIRIFTPPTADLFNITEMDVGRPITDFTHRLSHDEIEGEARRVLRDLSPIETELQSRDGRWFMMRIRPYRTVEDRIEGVVLTFVDITRRRESEHQLESSRQEYEMLFNSIDEGFSMLEVCLGEGDAETDIRFIEVNAAFARQTGLADVEGRTTRELVPDLEAHWYEVCTRVVRTSGSERIEGLVAPLGRFYECYVFPVPNAGENRIGCLFRDISERKRTEQRQDMLTHELSHRVKNTLAVVQAIARRPVKPDMSIEDFRKTFVGRIRALSHAHDQLLDTRWESAELGKLVEATLKTYGEPGDGRIQCSGPDILLSPRQALCLALVLHELGTNAAKYGALSSHEGRLSVTWTIERKEGVSGAHMTWCERDGPPIDPGAAPENGFGMQLLKQAAAFELGGTVDVVLGAEGLRAAIAFPLE